MKVYYDLHIHSALSPCGDNDMTPNNIVNMSILKGLDVIAVTDHNACGNVRSVIEASDGRILVIPGMEIETSEEVHVVSLFPTPDAAEEMEKIIREHKVKIANKPDIFGHQYLMDANDEIIGEESDLYLTSSGLDIYTVVNEVKKLGGVAYPAHIDRDSYSVLSNLGMIPPDLSVETVEITASGRERLYERYSKEYNVITSSDAHYLGDISEQMYSLDISNKKIDEILAKLLFKN